MEQEYPELRTRIQSTFIDVILMAILMFAAASIMDKMGFADSEESGITKAIVFVAIWGLYEPIATASGATLGNYLMKIRVRKENARNKKLNILQAFVRFVFKMGLGWISFLTIHSNKQKRAIHDMVAGSVMLEK